MLFACIMLIIIAAGIYDIKGELRAIRNILERKG